MPFLPENSLGVKWKLVRSGNQQEYFFPFEAQYCPNYWTFCFGKIAYILTFLFNFVCIFFFIFRLLSSFIKENGLWMWTSIGKSKSCLQEKRSCRCKRLGKVSTRLDYESTCLSVLNVHDHDSSDDKSVTNWFIWPWKLQVYLIFVHFSTIIFFSHLQHQMTCFFCCVDGIRIWQLLFFPFFQHYSYQGNNRIVAVMQNSIFRWYFRYCQHHPCCLLLLQWWMIGLTLQTQSVFVTISQNVSNL